VDLKSIKFIASPNFSARGGNKPQIIVLHCPVGTLQSTVATFQSPISKVSAHYVVDRDGSVVQMVDLQYAAWHAMHYPNIIGIGIEMVDRYVITGSQLSRGCMGDPNWFTKPQIDAVADLVAALMKQFNIPIAKVMGHNDPWLRQFGNNHQDPGTYFPWFNFKRLLQANLSVHPPPAPVETPQLKLDIPLTPPREQLTPKPRKKRGRRLIKPPRKNRIYE